MSSATEASTLAHSVQAEAEHVEFHDAEEHDHRTGQAREEDVFVSPLGSPRLPELRETGPEDATDSERATDTGAGAAVAESGDTDGERAPEDDEAAVEAAEIDPVQFQEQLARAEELKKAGNDLYKQGMYEEAMAIAIDATYTKAIQRRMLANEALDKLDLALEDAKLVLEREPGNAVAKQKILTWEPIVKERQEKMKEEVLGKLKDLGNNILGRFGMSVDNFKMVQDPNTGSYSVNFQR